MKADAKQATRHRADVGASRADALGDPLQLLELRDPLAGGRRDPHGVATGGLSGRSGPLPHQAAIQASFGRHDTTGIRAHAGAEASDACDALGAEAYATGDRVAFRGAPSLHTAAHEAAHVVQQRAGVALKGGLGSAGDRYEKHADQVADLVVKGQSAEGALDAMAGTGAGAPAVQLKPVMGIDKSSTLATYDDVTGKKTDDHAVRFGGLRDDCGTAMDGWLYPNDNIVYGGAPSVVPSWWWQMHSDAEKAKPGASAWISTYVVQGHLLNDNLGGPGHDLRNLTPIAKGCNSHHSAKVESDVKDWVNVNKSIAHYSVVPQYTSTGPDASWFDYNIPAKYLKKFPRSLKIVHEEYNGKTRSRIQGFDTTTTNAIRGKG